MNKFLKRGNTESKNLGGEGCEDFEKIDTSQIIEKGKREKLEILKPREKCEICGSSSIRKRTIDLPILNESMVIKHVKTFYCTHCGNVWVEKSSLEGVHNRLRELLDTHISQQRLEKIVARGLEAHEKRWTALENERKVISIYFPSKAHGPKKAQISMKASDPLLPKVRSLKSEDLRNLLGFHYYEDLEKAAEVTNRTISQYMKVTLAEKLTGFLEPRKDRSSERILTLFPKWVERDYFQRPQEAFALAAQSMREQMLVAETPDQEFSGVLTFDYETASLLLNVIRNNLRLRSFDVTVILNDDRKFSRPGALLKNNKIALLEGAEDIKDDVARIILKSSVRGV